MKSLWSITCALLASAALAAASQEISFYYPIAVGGPITKIVDQMAADFEKENPGIKVKPVYTGTYQETIVKALTAHKSGNPPATAILLSTDMFTLIDEDAIVPFSDLAKSPDDAAWMKSFYPAFMANGQIGGECLGRRGQEQYQGIARGVRLLIGLRDRGARERELRDNLLEVEAAGGALLESQACDPDHFGL